MFAGFLCTFAKMAKKKPIIDNLILSEEYSQIIQKIVKLISDRDMAIELRLRELSREADTLDKYAGQAENKIKAHLIGELRDEVRRIISRSANKLIVATLLPESN